MRADQVRRAVQLVLRGSSVALVGPRLSGRSTALGLIGEELRARGESVLHVVPQRGAPELEPLRLAVPRRVRAPIDSGPLTFAGVHGLVEEYLLEGGHVVLVDDADQLDGPSRAVLALARRRTGRPAVVTLPPRAASGAGRWVAAALQPVVDVVLGPLSVPEVQELAESRLGGPVSDAAAIRAHDASGGSPGVALAVLDGAVTHGGLRQVEGTWVGDDMWSPDLDGFFAASLSGLRRSERDAVEVLALAGAVPSPVAGVLVAPRLLDRIEALGLLRLLDVGGEHLVVVTPPGLADVLGRAPTTARRRALAEAAAQRVVQRRGPAGEEVEPVLARLRARLDHAPGSAAVTGPSSAGDVGRVVAERHRLDLAVAHGTWRTRRGVTEAVELIRLQLSGTGDPGVVDRVLRETDAEPAADSFAYVELCYLRARWRIARGAGHLAAAAELEAAAADHVRYRESLLSLAVALRAEFGVVPGDYERELAPRTSGTGWDAATARVALATCRVLSGAAQGAERALGPDGCRWPDLLHAGAELVRGLASYGQGRFDDVLAVGRSLVDRAADRGDHAAFVGGCYLAALVRTARLDVDRARRDLLPVQSAGLRAGAMVLCPDRAVAVLLAASSTSPRDDDRRVRLTPGEGGNAAGDALPFGSDIWLAASLHARDDPVGAARRLDEAVASLLDRGQRLAAETMLIHRSLLHHDDDRAAEVEEVARRTGGRLYPTLLAARRAMTDGDPRALMIAAGRLEEADAVEEAARCYLSAAGMFRLAGRHGDAAQARAAARTLQGADAADAAAGATQVLSERELEIARLVADGAANGDIASRLVLSRRTVESHVRNIKRKTGARDRAGVAALARD
ncbi:helix-turn-helix transcriptional regulator [Cellulomonas sp. GbtcB1]|uniref:helix-turn-helix transcriptional regulator n=1 Tax=Cellulomonas sp. GbtcB1 TaxID=2824746 RepID=UPI001C30A6D8|nr:helix-turn-helix transcriptional regulator [Cellulomonas sp. GbtcB1]